METLVLHSLDLFNGSGGAHGFADVLPQSLAAVGTFLAQNIEDPDVVGQMQRWFQNFVESGQLWALIIGFVFGFGFKSLLPG